MTSTSSRSRLSLRSFVADERVIGAEVSAQRVDRLVERAAGALFGLVRPEKREDLFARHARPAGAREQCEHRETSRLRRGPSDHIPVRDDADAA